MRMARFVSLIGFLISLACQSAHQVGTSEKPSVSAGLAPQSQPASDFQGVKTIADIAKFAWVNKRCRLWAADGDIDVDQTCLVVRRVGGGLVVIPNEYVDSETKELDELSRKTQDKWIQRFYGIGGGEKSVK
jgi:hypothetical protein